MMPMAPIREPHTWTDCGRPYWNRGAHAEECRGAPADFFPCGHRVTTPERRCRLPYGHTGDHEYVRGL